MRVLMTADTLGGVWTYALQLAKALRPAGVEVVLAAMTGGAPLSADQRAAAMAVGNIELVEGRYRLEWMDGSWGDVDRSGEWLLDLEARHRPDVVHLGGFSHAVLETAAPMVVVAHSCVLTWWRAVHGGPAPRDYHIYRQRVAAGLRGADEVVAPTRAMLAALEREYGPLDRTTVIHNGRDSQPAGRCAKEPLVLAVGRVWDDGKNLALVETAASHLQWPVRIIGDARSPNGIETPIERSRHLGVLPGNQVAKWMARASIYALPARYEPFGLSVLEAALAGCALVLGAIPSLHELWDGAAMFVPPNDRRAFCRAVDSLASDDAMRARYAEAARARALACYSAERMGDAYLSLYERLLHPSGGAGRRHSAGGGELACAS